MTLALLFLVAIVLILVGSELFTNAVEWFGYRLGLGHGATGSVLAAIGTALPETFVPIVALIAAAPSAESVAMGAVLGAPLLLITLGMAVTGVAVIFRRGERVLSIEPRQARLDLGVFLGAFAVDVCATALPFRVRLLLGVALLAAYGGYVSLTVRGGAPAEELPEPLHVLRPFSGRNPGFGLVGLQLLIAIACLVSGSQFFVHALDEMARALNANPLVIALIVVPVATELPETMNSVLWVRSRDDGLAFGNVAGSATFQACVLGFVGVTFTSWRPGRGGLMSTVATLLTGVMLLLVLRDGRCRGRWLLLAAVPWLAYVVVALSTGAAAPG